jgi:hypothetical protein
MQTETEVGTERIKHRDLSASLSLSPFSVSLFLA